MKFYNCVRVNKYFAIKVIIGVIVYTMMMRLHGLKIDLGMSFPDGMPIGIWDMDPHVRSH